MLLKLLQFILFSADSDFFSSSVVSLSFTSGQGVGNTVCSGIVIQDDSIVEDNEFFFLSLSTSDQKVKLSQLNFARVRIDDNDSEYYINCSIVVVLSLLLLLLSQIYI